jgi:hypothetical protein
MRGAGHLRALRVPHQPNPVMRTQEARLWLKPHRATKVAVLGRAVHPCSMPAVPVASPAHGRGI